MKNGEIKKNRKMHFVYLSFLFLMFFLLVATLTPQYDQQEGLGIMISIVTFLFGFFISNSFSMLRTRIGNLKLALSHETGSLVSMFYLSKSFGKKFSDEIKELIDRYAMLTINYFDEYERSREIFSEFYTLSDKFKIKNKNEEKKVGSFYSILGKLSNIREEEEYLTKPYLLQSVRVVNYVLGIILVGLLYIYRMNLLTNILFVALSTIVVFALLIMEDYDNINVGEYTASISNAEELFDLIGNSRYYPVELLHSAELEKGKMYRIGFKDVKTGEYSVKNYSYVGAKKLTDEMR